MREEDASSRLHNHYQPVRELDQLVQRCDERLVLSSVAEARKIIKDLVKVIKKDILNMGAYEDNVKTLEVHVTRQRKKMKEKDKALQLANDLRAFYQQIVMKLGRDANLFNRYQEDLDKFVEIDEWEHDLDL